MAGPMPAGPGSAAGQPVFGRAFAGPGTGSTSGGSGAGAGGVYGGLAAGGGAVAGTGGALFGAIASTSQAAMLAAAMLAGAAGLAAGGAAVFMDQTGGPGTPSGQPITAGISPTGMNGAPTSGLRTSPTPVASPTPSTPADQVPSKMPTAVAPGTAPVPVPEPASTVIFLMGSAGAILTRGKTSFSLRSLSPWRR